MVHTPSRRAFLLGTSSALLSATAGCLSSGGTDQQDESTTTPPTTTSDSTSATPSPPPAGTYADTPSGPASYPARPDDVTPDSALAYAEQFEHARTRNVLHEPDVEDLHVDCTAIHDTDDRYGQYVLATCTGYANYADGVHADWGQQPAIYFVGEGVTIRAASYRNQYHDCEDVFASSDRDENFAEPCEGQTASYRAYNLSPDRRSLSVTVEFVGDDRDEAVLERTYDLDSTEAVRQESVTYRRGTYRLAASLDDGADATFEWDLRSKPTWEDSPVTVLVTPTGGVEIRRVPFHDV